MADEDDTYEDQFDEEIDIAEDGALLEDAQKSPY
jgi:hypothetical protein